MAVELLGDTLLIPCEACQKSVTAPVEILGQLVECPFCQQHFIAREQPPAHPKTAAEMQALEAEIASLEGQLRENETQVTELRGHVSRLNMELHRHQLRMKTLAERQSELKSGIATAREELSRPV